MRLKYRPKSLAEIKSTYFRIFQQFQGFIQQNNFPHLILVGPKGSGKTMLSEILAREILKHEFEINHKLLFADDPIGKQDRDLTRQQGRISTSRVGSGAGVTRRYRPFIQIRVRPFVSSQKFGDSPFKILIIKNFHKLDVEQQAFRRIMEKYSNNCRMILITDRISGIIDPIISRCQLIMVPYLPQHLFNKTVKMVCDKEKISINLDLLTSLMHLSKFNVGKSLDLIQLTQIRYNEITLEKLSKMESEINYSIVRNLFTQTFNSNFSSIRTTLRQIFQRNNLSKEEILLELNRIIIQLPLERDIRAFYLNLIAESDFSSINSNDDEIQLNSLLSKMSLIGKMIK